MATTKPSPGEALTPSDFVNTPALAAEPQAHYQRLRERGGVLREPLGVRVISADLVDQVLRNPTVFRSGSAVTLGNRRPLIPLQVDPPAHRRYRQFLDPLFAATQVNALQPQLTAFATTLLDRFAHRGHCDAISELAVPFPAMVLLHLLGLPQADLPDLLRLKDAIVRPTGPAAAAQQHQQAAAGAQIYQYFTQALAARHRQPGPDLISRLLANEVDGDRLTDQEILDICFLLLLAGLDTVANTLGCALAYLAQRPDLPGHLATNPSLLATAVEELLRWESPTALVGRVAATETALGGCPVHEGDLVTVLLGAANTDGRLFPNAEQVDLARHPNPHVAFGGGIHRCVGAYLARLELRTVLRQWHDRIPRYWLEPGAVLRYDYPLRAIQRLVLLFPATEGH